jgi:hypothetical protein
VEARFFAHLQTGPESHPASCTRGPGPFQGVKRPGHGTNHPPPSSAEVKGVYSYTSTPSGISSLLRGTYLSLLLKRYKLKQGSEGAQKCRDVHKAF